MTRKEDSAKQSNNGEIWKKSLAGAGRPDWLPDLVQEVVQQVLEGDMG